jgi:L-fuculose-phosphate aldolase
VVYRERPAVGAIIHSRSPAATAFALAHRSLPCRAEPVPVVAWAPRGSQGSVLGIEQAVHASTTTSAVLLANHGLLTFGADPMQTAQPDRAPCPSRPVFERNT